jgi:hypothetical protein
MGAQAKQLQRPSPFQRNNEGQHTAAPLNDRDFRDRHDELGAPAADIGELGHDLVFEVPRQDQHVVGLGLGNLFERENRNVGTRQIFALLVRIAVNRIGFYSEVNFFTPGAANLIGVGPAVFSFRYHAGVRCTVSVA